MPAAMRRTTVRPEALPDWPEFLQVAFETPAGEVSLLEETESGAYFVVRVDEVMPPRVKPVDEVRPQLVEGWQAEKRRELARQRAEELLAQLKDGASLDELATAQNLTVDPDRAGRAQRRRRRSGHQSRDGARAVRDRARQAGRRRWSSSATPSRWSRPTR